MARDTQTFNDLVDLASRTAQEIGQTEGLDPKVAQGVTEAGRYIAAAKQPVQPPVLQPAPVATVKPVGWGEFAFTVLFGLGVGHATQRMSRRRSQVGRN